MDPSAILSALLGGVIALSGVALAQWWSARRDRANREHQGELQRAGWRRSDYLRAADRKRDAAKALLREVGRYVFEVHPLRDDEVSNPANSESVIREANIRLHACLEDLVFEFESEGEAVKTGAVLRAMVAVQNARDMDIAQCNQDFMSAAYREIRRTESGDPT